MCGVGFQLYSQYLTPHQELDPWLFCKYRMHKSHCLQQSYACSSSCKSMEQVEQHPISLSNLPNFLLPFTVFKKIYQTLILPSFPAIQYEEIFVIIITSSL